MKLSDINIKFNDMMNKLVNSMQTEGVDSFCKSPASVKEHIGVTEQDVEELNDESVFYCNHEDWAKAIEAVGWLIFFEPLNASHYLRMGSIYLQTQDYTQALGILLTGSLLDSENPKFFLYIGSCYLMLGEKDLAKKAFARAEELSKNNPEYKEVFSLATLGHCI